MSTISLLRLHPSRARALTRAADSPHPPTEREELRFAAIPTDLLIRTAARLSPSELSSQRTRTRAIRILTDAERSGDWDLTFDDPTT